MNVKYQRILDKVPDVEPENYDAIPRQNIAFCGAHGTGKTTLAIALEQKLGIPYIPIDASDVFLQCKFHPSDKLDIRNRLFVQQKILEKAEGIWFDVDEPSFICDRSPLDMAAYLLADVGNGELDQRTQDEIDDYLADCFLITKRYFKKIVLIPPVIRTIPREYKGASNKPLIQALHCTLIGLLSDWDLPHKILPKACVSVSDRVQFVEDYLKE